MAPASAHRATSRTLARRRPVRRASGRRLPCSAIRWTQASPCSAVGLVPPVGIGRSSSPPAARDEDPRLFIAPGDPLIPDQPSRPLPAPVLVAEELTQGGEQTSPLIPWHSAAAVYVSPGSADRHDVSLHRVGLPVGNGHEQRRARVCPGRLGSRVVRGCSTSP